MSTIVREVVPRGMPKVLADQGWALEKNDGTPPRYHAVNETLDADLGPFPSMDEAQTSASNYGGEEQSAKGEEVGGQKPEVEDHPSAQHSALRTKTLPAMPPIKDGEELLLHPDEVRTDGGTQPRALFEDEVVNQYKEAMLGGAKFPPIDVFWDGENYWLADGFYRTEATKRAEMEEVWATVHLGTQRDAILFSLSANETHGQPRTNADKRRAVTTMLMDPEWTTMSDGEIARKVDVSQPFVSGLRRELTTQNVLSEQTTRVGADGVARDTANIGRKSEDEIEEARAANPELFEQEAVSQQRAKETAVAGRVQDPVGWSKASVDIRILIKPGKGVRARRLIITGSVPGDIPPITRKFETDDIDYELEYGIAERLYELVEGLKQTFAMPDVKLARARKPAEKARRKLRTKKPARVPASRVSHKVSKKIAARSTPAKKATKRKAKKK